jgi:transcriptional regulator with PAS, ATPase and Fis domain
VVAATNRDPRDQVARGRFRKDLYYRLATATYTLPALRDRPDDIAPFTRHRLMELGREDGRVVTASPAALDALASTPFARERARAARRAGAGQVHSRRADPDADILTALGEVRSSSTSGDQKRRRARAALLANRFNATHAAKRLGIGRATFYRWLAAEV